ncbi:MAG: PQQ-dependent sugar dehydrogenase [Nitrospirota bacterium]
MAASASCLVAQAQAPPSAPPPVAPPPGIALGLEQITPALNFPLFLTASPGDNNRLFVVEKGGRIRIINRNTKALQGTFLDITALVSTGGEQGLLGLAFDPQYAVNRRFYVSYTDAQGRSVIARYLTDPVNPDQALPQADRVLLTLTQPFANHNGGMIAFGPDGFLYIGFGDGGSGGDPQNHAQNLNDLLGKLLRIDVSQATQPPMPAYAIPASNPCVGQPGIRGELWSLGLRNPWRFSFDRASGDLYIADVGQSEREEINVSLSSDRGGKGLNYGWNVMEGTLCFPIGAPCSQASLTLPFVEYDHTQGCSITGGYVYRGQAIANLQGTYFYADFCTGFVRSFRFVNGQVTEHADWGSLNPGGNITSFGEDAAGELHVMTAQGGLFRIVSN